MNRSARGAKCKTLSCYFKKFLCFSLAGENIEERESGVEEKEEEVEVVEKTVHSSPDPLPQVSSLLFLHLNPTFMWGRCTMIYALM